MLSKFVQRRSVLFPTPLGCIAVFVIAGLPLVSWWFWGERFLSSTVREPAEILVVESWINVEGIRAAKDEFEQGKYHYLVTTGSLTGHRWNARRWSTVEIAERELQRLNFPADR